MAAEDSILLEGDCRDVMELALAENSVDSIVTDPPYGLSFMNRHWDCDVPKVEMWRAAFAVLKPGGYLLAFSGTRTYHRMVCAIEDAGFEIRDQVQWIYGSGFPKSRNGEWGGTALKPAHEPIVVARKPLIGTVEANFKEWGVGGLNIDGCRVGDEVRFNAAAANKAGGNSLNMSAVGMPQDAAGREAIGRWPANLIHDGSDEVLACFPQAVGQIADASSSSEKRKTQNVYGDMRRGRGTEPSANSENNGVVGFGMKPGARRTDAGSAARFFYCAKASKADRNAGCDDLPDKLFGMSGAAAAAAAVRGEHYDNGDGGVNKTTLRKNNHPTVKPTDLMRYLCRLVTPAGGTVLDPFMGSGSTGRGAVLEGFKFIGIEQDPAYLEIARARIEEAQRGR